MPVPGKLLANAPGRPTARIGHGRNDVTMDRHDLPAAAEPDMPARNREIRAQAHEADIESRARGEARA